MKNRNIVHAREEAKIYGEYYRPSLNLVRFAKSIVSAFLYGSSTTTGCYWTSKQRTSK